MTMIAPALPRVKFDSARVARPARPFGFGLFAEHVTPTVRPTFFTTPAARPSRGPSAEDHAFEAGRTAAIETGHGDVVPPRVFAAKLRPSWLAGVASGLAELESRLADAELQARWDGLAGPDREYHERAEAGLSPLPAIAND